MEEDKTQEQVSQEEGPNGGMCWVPTANLKGPMRQKGVAGEEEGGEFPDWRFELHVPERGVEGEEGRVEMRQERGPASQKGGLQSREGES